MPEIIPALLTNNIQDLDDKLTKLKGLVDWVQIDIMDNKFVPNISIDVAELKNLQSLKNFKTEIHLMVLHPENVLQKCLDVDAKRVIFHFEALEDVDKMIAELDKFGFEKGLAINPDTSVEQIKPYLDKLDLVLLMSVYPGFQGQKFIPEVLNKVKELKTLAPNLKLSIDGGINASNIKEVAESGLDYVSVGSALFVGGEVEGNVKILRDLIFN